MITFASLPKEHSVLLCIGFQLLPSTMRVFNSLEGKNLILTLPSVPLGPYTMLHRDYPIPCTSRSAPLCPRKAPRKYQEISSPRDHPSATAYGQ